MPYGMDIYEYDEERDGKYCWITGAQWAWPPWTRYGLRMGLWAYPSLVSGLVIRSGLYQRPMAGMLEPRMACSIARELRC